MVRTPAELSTGVVVAGALGTSHRVDAVAPGHQPHEPGRHSPWARRADRRGERRQPVRHASGFVVDDVVDGGPVAVECGDGRGGRVIDMNERPHAGAQADDRHSPSVGILGHRPVAGQGVSGAVEVAVAQHDSARAPVGSLQGLAPDRVIYLGTTSKALSPALRIAWLVLPPELVDAVVDAKALDDLGSPTLEQLALAHLIETAAYDRYLRSARRRNRVRRDALLAAVAELLPGAEVTGISAGLHALVRLAADFDAVELTSAAAARSVGIYPLGFHLMDPPRRGDALVLGYANLSEAAIGEGVRRLAGLLG